MPPASMVHSQEDAVSPVIGVILLVAITVVLSVVVFTLATKTSGNQASETPTFGATRDESRDDVDVVGANAAATYGQFKLISDKPVAFRLNAHAGLGATSTDASAGAPVVLNASVTPLTVAAGNFISLCGGTTTAGVDQTQVEVKVIHTESNRQVWAGTFVTVLACG